MTPPQHFLAVLGIVLFFGLLLPRLLRPLHLPFATLLILAGALLGPNGAGYVASDDNLVLFAFLGAMFQMLLAGSESRTIGIRLAEPALVKLVVLNGVLPAATGVFIARAFDYDWVPSLFVGTVFLSSSILLVFGIARASGIGTTRAGRLLKGAAVVEDLGASILAFLLFQTLQPHHRFPLPILAGLLLASVLMLRMFLPEIVAFFFRRFASHDDAEETHLRVVVAMLLLIVFAYSLLNVHPVIAAFLVGFSLAGIPEAPALRGRLESIGFGLFIPVFLFVVGLETDLRVVLDIREADGLALAIVGGAAGSKLVGGFIGARWAGLAAREAAAIGIASMARLAVPLSATYAARDLGVIDSRLFSAIVVVSVLTSLLAPLLMAPFWARPAAEEKAGA